MDSNIWGDIVAPSMISNVIKKSSVKEKAQTDDKIKKIDESLYKLGSINDRDPIRQAWKELVELITDEDRDEEFTTFKDLLSTASALVNDRSITGVALIHYIIVYDKPGYIELLTSQSGVLDLNLLDELVGFSPLMWCFWLSRKECCVELFTVSDRLDFQLKNKEGHTAWDLLNSGSSMYSFLEQNNMLKYGMIDVLTSSTIVATNASPMESGLGSTISQFDVDTSNISDNIDKKIAGLNLYDNDDFNGKIGNDMMFGSTDDNNDINDYEKFDFTRLEEYQYLEYSDYDIPQILDYLINLPKSHPHMTTYPASLLFQCARYSDHKRKSKTDTESLLFLAFTKITASVSTVNNSDTSTETTEADDKDSNKKHDDIDNPKPKQTVDIVTQSYWISALTYLYYYLTKDESFFKRHPNILQELINALHTIIVELVTSIHLRLVPVIQKTLLNYTTIEDVKQTLYKRDWNFFKKRKQAKLAQKEKERKLLKQQELALKQVKSDSNCNDVEDPDMDEEDENNINVIEDGHNKDPVFDTDILKHLYPPSLEEQMKPSPMKIVQIFGALSYVLNLHQIHPLFQQQCLSIAINWFSTTIFNQILKDKKKKILSRARAVQIRLNLSTLESWIRNNDIKLPRPELIDDFMWERFPFTLIQDLGDIDLDNPTLHSITRYRPVDSLDSGKTITDETNSLFYYQTFHQIAFLHLGPVFQLLQWLQIASTLDSEEALENTMKLLPQLSPSQLLKAIDKYNYEVNEHKFSSKLRKYLSKLNKATLIKTTYLEEKQIPLLCLPTVTELTDLFSKDQEAQPFLPDDIQDAIYEVHDANHKLRMNDMAYEESESEPESVSEQGGHILSTSIPPQTDTSPTQESSEKHSDYGASVSLGENVDISQNDTIFSNYNAPSPSVSGPSWAVSSTNNEEVEANPW